MDVLKTLTTSRAFCRWCISLSMLACLTMGVTPAQEATAVTAPSSSGDVQTEASRIYVFVDKKGIGHQHGVEAKLKQSTLVLGASENAGQLVFDMTSFDADTPTARRQVGLSGITDEGTRAAVNANMRGSAILNVAKYPIATFDVISAKATGGTSQRGLPTYQLEGQFTLCGTTRPLSIEVDVEQARGWLHVRGNFLIDQTSFGIKPYSKAFGAIGVANQLKIYGDLFVAPTQHIVIAEIPARK